MERTDHVPPLPLRPVDAHKGTAGRVLVVAGSYGMAGAVRLCAEGALRGGAGLVYCAVPSSVYPIIAPSAPCMVFIPCDETDGAVSPAAVERILRHAGACDVVAVGPGLSRHPAAAETVRGLLRRLEAPLVLDADGLNAAAEDTSILKEYEHPLVITPHPGEMARLLGTDTGDVQRNREHLAASFAHEHGCTVVLKGYRTVVTDGKRSYLNPTGNSGMATAGSGDVLTGLIAALIAQGTEPFDAAVLGVWLHGTAGDAAAARLTPYCMTALDILEVLPEAFVRRISPHRRRSE